METKKYEIECTVIVKRKVVVQSSSPDLALEVVREHIAEDLDVPLSAVTPEIIDVE